MYAIVDIAGQQFKAEKDRKLIVHRLKDEVGANVGFNNVMLIDNNGKVVVGEPFIEGATVNAKILSHMKGEKVIIFKKKRRKSYQKASGHRQLLTMIQIENINEKPLTVKKAKVKADAEITTEIETKEN